MPDNFLIGNDSTGARCIVLRGLKHGRTGAIIPFEDGVSDMNAITLMHEARFSARQRGHKLGKFSKGNSEYSGRRHAVCKVCGMMVLVDPNPAPNGIELSGEALALDCPGWPGFSGPSCTLPKVED